jgi:hypothetical protein
LLRGEGIVSVAAQAQIFEAMCAAAGERLEVMELETLRLAATDAALVEVGALALVPLEDGVTELGRNVSAAPARRLHLTACS